MNVLDLGIKDYKETLELQYQLVQQRANNEIENTIIFVEHPHVLTTGRKFNPENILINDIPVYEVERGGDVTYHGYGQLVGYPIIDYKATKDINLFLRTIEEVLIKTLKNYEINANRKEKYTGVWVNDRKIASIGISFKNWISFHGFALNISTDLNYFYKINPCGLNSSVMINLEDLLEVKINLSEIKENIFINFTKLFK